MTRSAIVRFLRATVILAMLALAIPTLQVAGLEKSRCGNGDHILCTTIRYCLFFCWTREFYMDERSDIPSDKNECADLDPDAPDSKDCL